MYLKNPASDDAFGSQSYKLVTAKDSNNGTAKPEGSHHTSSDPQSLPTYGAQGDKDMKAGADAQATNPAEKLAESAADGSGSKELAQSAMPSSVTGATGSAAAE